MAKTDRGDFDGAIADFNRVLASDPKDAGVYLDRGLAELDRGDLEGAMDDFKRGGQLDPKNPAAWTDQGIVDFEKNDPEGALADFSQALALDPKQAQALVYRGLVKRAQRDAAGALADFRAGAMLDNRTPAFFAFLALAEQGHPDDGNHELTAALGQPAAPNPDPQGWQARMGAFLLGQINFEALVSTINTPFDFIQRSRRCEAWFYQGMLQEIAGREKEAKNSFEQARATKRQNAFEYRVAGWELRSLATPTASPTPGP